MMNIKEFFSNWIVKNLLLACALVAVVVGVVSVILSLVTLHGKEIEVPDFSDMTAAQASSTASAAGLEAVVTDSVYISRMKPGVVYLQNPKAGSHVKKGRKIRLTTNTMMPTMVNMPSLVGVSLRQAKAELLRNSLTLGKITYEPDIATNNVLRQRRFGYDIAPGTPLASGTAIELVLGLGEDNMTYVPKMEGLSYLGAIDVAQDNSLNISCVFDRKGVKDYADSLAAVVVSQTPAPAEAVLKGTRISVRLAKQSE